MTCPGCRCDLGAMRAGEVAVCQSCARSVVKDGKVMRFATATDLHGLSADQIKELRLSRPVAWRNNVRARHAQIVSR